MKGEHNRNSKYKLLSGIPNPIIDKMKGRKKTTPLSIIYTDQIKQIFRNNDVSIQRINVCWSLRFFLILDLTILTIIKYKYFNLNHEIKVLT